MTPCWVEVTINSPYAVVDGKKELKNLAVFETIRTGEDGVTEIWKDGRCARVRETPAQIWAKIQEASK
jgi:gamma-glutamyl:cysteine ligase YbdK (ATP-grasp superfamily)